MFFIQIRSKKLTDCSEITLYRRMFRDLSPYLNLSLEFNLKENFLSQCNQMRNKQKENSCQFTMNPLINLSTFSLFHLFFTFLFLLFFIFPILYFQKIAAKPFINSDKFIKFESKYFLKYRYIDSFIKIYIISLKKTYKTSEIKIIFFNQRNIFSHNQIDKHNTKKMSNISDQQLRTYIDQIFMKYDRDRSGSLSANQLVYFFNDLFQLMGNPRRVSQYQAESAIRQIDRNNDGQASKQQLYLAFRQILGAQQPVQPNYGNYGQQNSGWGQQNNYQGGYNQQSGWGNQPTTSQGWNQPQTQGWNNQQPQYGYNQSGWGQQPQQPQQGWNNNPQQQNYSGWGNQPQQPNYQKNWGSNSGW